MTYIIVEPCINVKDTACVEVCPVDCIHGKDDDNQLFIDPEECIDCGACEPACPVQAIFPEEEVPEKWNSFIPLNYKYFGQEPPA
jgi:ferredoxin